MMTPLVDDWTALPSFGSFTENEDGLPSVLGFKPYYFQQEAHDSVFAEWDKGIRSTLLEKATGCGKTITFGMVAKTAIEERAGTVLILAHRDELLEQAQAKLSFVGVHSAIEKASQKARRTISDAKRDYFRRRDIKCVVASVQSMKGKRLESWPRDYFTHLISDECHHSLAKSYTGIYKYFAGAKHLGVTATPIRTDKQNLGEVFQSVAYRFPLPRAIEEEFLAPIVWEKSDVKIDLRTVNANAEDLNQGDLEDAIAPFIEQMVRAIKERIGERRAILFAPGRKSVNQKIRPSQAFAEGLRKVGIRAEAVWGDHPDRLALSRGFAANEFQVLCNADLLTEGYDAPFCEAIILARPTKSAGLFSQMIGRGTRLSKATGKTNCVVIDFQWQIEKHRLCTPFNLVCPQATEDAEAVAAQIIASGEEKDIIRAADLAIQRVREERERREAEEKRRKFEEEVRKLKAEQLKRAKQERLEAKRARLEREKLNLRVRPGESGLQFKSFDPFASVFKLAGLKPSTGSKSHLDSPATTAQVNVLLSYGIPENECNRLTFDEAKEMRSWCFDRYQKNMAPLWLVRKLISGGVAENQALQLRKSEAFDLRDKLGLNQQRRYG